MLQPLSQSSVQELFAIVAENTGKQVDVRGQSLEILKAIDLKIKRGESLAIVGRSGSGKTTLLGLLAGLDIPTTGTISLMGHALDTMTEDQRADVRAQHVGFVFQSFHLLPAMTALENVMLPLELKADPLAKAHAKDYLFSVGLGDRLGHYPPQLSGGEQQRVALARAFACKPDILFADEPTGNLDLETGQTVIDLLFELNEAHNTTLVMVTHDEMLASRCSRSVRISGGCIDSGEAVDPAQAVESGEKAEVAS